MRASCECSSLSTFAPVALQHVDSVSLVKVTYPASNLVSATRYHQVLKSILVRYSKRLLWSSTMHPSFFSRPGSFGTTQPLGAAVLRKQAAGTFGPPVEALRNDPNKYLKKGTKSPTGTGLPSENGGAGVGDAKKGPTHAFTYPGER